MIGELLSIMSTENYQRVIRQAIIDARRLWEHNLFGVQHLNR